MCLENPTTKEPLVAKRNITVYKWGSKVGDMLETPFRHFVYQKGTNQPRIRLTIDFCSWGNLIEKGYHSFKTKDCGLGSNSDEVAIGKFIIPKGTKYYGGTFAGYDNYVSETIIFKGFI